MASLGGIWNREQRLLHGFQGGEQAHPVFLTASQGAQVEILFAGFGQHDPLAAAGLDDAARREIRACDGRIHQG